MTDDGTIKHLGLGPVAVAAPADLGCSVGLL